jgi:hypothetical protein
MIKRKYILVPKGEATKSMVDKSIETSLNTLVKYVAPDKKEYYWLKFNKVPAGIVYTEKTQKQAKILADTYKATLSSTHEQDTEINK